MRRRAFPLVLVLIIMPALSMQSSSAPGGEYYNSGYGWRIAVPEGFSIDESYAPESVAFYLDDGGVVSIEGGLPGEFFWDAPSAFASITRLMSFVAEEVRIDEQGTGETPEGIYYEDIIFQAVAGAERIQGLIRLYAGPNGIALCYRDDPTLFDYHIDEIRRLADSLYFPTLQELLDERSYEPAQFTNPAYGYRVEYPSFLTHDEIWSYVSFSFLNSSIMDVYAGNRIESNALEMLENLKQETLEESAGYDYLIFNETQGATDAGIPYLDFIIDEGDDSGWLKRVRMFAAPNVGVKFQIYGSGSDFDINSPIFDMVVGAFEFNEEWVTDESYGYFDIPIEAFLESGAYEWVPLEGSRHDYTMNIPEFLFPEEFDDMLFLNYGYETIFTVIPESYRGLDARAALAASEAAALEEFGTMWEFSRHGDVAGFTEDGWPYIDFLLNDNDPEGSWTKRVRVFGADGLAVRIEMYVSPEQSDMLSELFAELAGTFSFGKPAAGYIAYN